MAGEYNPGQNKYPGQLIEEAPDKLDFVYLKKHEILPWPANLEYNLGMLRVYQRSYEIEGEHPVFKKENKNKHVFLRIDIYTNEHLALFKIIRCGEFDGGLRDVSDVFFLKQPTD